MAMSQQPDSAFYLDHVRTVAIFGAGRYGKLAAEFAARCGWELQYFVDNSQHLRGSALCDAPIREPDALTREKVDLVLIASEAHFHAIAGQLEHMGLVHGCDYVSALAPIQIGAVRLHLSV
jgi:predicted dehydrogenase